MCMMGADIIKMAFFKISINLENNRLLLRREEDVYIHENIVTKFVQQ
jgi:hypothetical protein